MKKYSGLFGCLAVALAVLCFPVLTGNGTASANTTITAAALPTLLGYGATDSLPMLVALPQLMGYNDAFAAENSVTPVVSVASTSKTGCGCCSECKCTNCGFQQMPAGKVQYKQVCGPNGCRYVRVNNTVAYPVSGSPDNPYQCNTSYGGGYGDSGESGDSSGRRRLFNGNGPVRRIFSRCRR